MRNHRKRMSINPAIPIGYPPMRRTKDRLRRSKGVKDWPECPREHRHAGVEPSGFYTVGACTVRKREANHIASSRDCPEHEG